MKLPSPSEPVKPDRTVAAVAAVTAVVTLLAIQLVLLVTGSAEERMDRFGEAAASALAELTVEPLMRQDRMHLGVIGNRLAETPEITGVASFTSDHHLLTSTGDLSGPQYTAPVTIDDSIVGYVRLTVHPPAFTRNTPARLWGMLLAAVMAALLVIAAWTLGRAVHRGQLNLPRVPAWLAPRASGKLEEPEEQPAAAPVAAEPPPPVRHYLLAVNVYNQLTLGVSEREFERSLCFELTEAVAHIYQGQVVTLPGVGVLVDFDHTEDEDRALQVLCAAFVLTRLLRDESPFGQYRLGLNLTVRPADESLPLDDPAIADAALLSALGRDGALAVSSTFGETLQDTGRVVSRPLVNPLLDELTTGKPTCQLITALEPPFAGLVAQQAEQLALQRDEISNPSTF